MREIPFFITEYRNANPSSAKRYKAILVRDVESAYVGKGSISGPDTIFRDFGDIFRERNADAFYFIYLDNKRQPIGMESFPDDLVSGELVDFEQVARSVFRSAIMANANSFICVRWKVAGVVVKTIDNKIASGRLEPYATLMGIKMSDYIVMSSEVGEYGRWFGFADRGLIKLGEE